MNDEAVYRQGFRLLWRIGGPEGDVRHFTRTLRGLAVDDGNRLYAVGDSDVNVFSLAGELLRQWPTEKPGHSVAVDDSGRVWVGQDRQVEIFEPPHVPTVWRDEPRLGLVTAVAFDATHVYLADADARCIHRYDRSGNFCNDIGDQHRKGGFHIPNGAVDFAVDGLGILHVANPGMHRVERYTGEGQLLGHFGRFDGRDPEGFPGCCNPTNVAVDGKRVVVSEKAVPRVKVYDGSGHLLAVVATDAFDPTAKNMDVVTGPGGRVYVADTAALAILAYEPVAGEGAP
jgi:hypothetical protein